MSKRILWAHGLLLMGLLWNFTIGVVLLEILCFYHIKEASYRQMCGEICDPSAGFLIWILGWLWISAPYRVFIRDLTLWILDFFKMLLRKQAVKNMFFNSPLCCMGWMRDARRKNISRKIRQDLFRYLKTVSVTSVSVSLILWQKIDFYQKILKNDRFMV